MTTTPEPRKLTAGQLVALTTLHQRGRLGPIGGGRGYAPGRVMSTTVDALVAAGVAARMSGTEDVREAVRVRTDALGLWHVEVPASVHPDSRAAVARAVILGEVRARVGGTYHPLNGWRPRVQAEGDDGAGDPASATRFLYREV